MENIVSPQEPLTPIDPKTKDSKTLTWIVVAVIFTAIIVGGIMYAWQRSVISKLQLESQKQNQELQRQTTPPYTSPPKEGAISNNTDTRRLLTQEEYKYKEGSALSSDLYDEFTKPGVTNLMPPTTYVNYENKDRGIGFSVPYNSDWGSTKYKISPYEYEKGVVTDKGVDNERIVFGPIQPWEGGGLTRLLSLSFIPARTADFIMENTIAVVNPERKTINGLQVVETSPSGFCASSDIEIIGKTYNYVLSNSCDSSYDMKYLESLVEKINII